MVPYTLTKRKQDSIKSERAKAMKAKSRGKTQTQAAGDGSDSDEEPVSFFSHLEATTSTGASVTEKDTKSASISGKPLPPVPTPLPEHVATSSASSISSAYSTAPALMDHQDDNHATSTDTHSSIGSTSTASSYNPPNSAPSLPNSQQTQTHTHSSQYSWDQLTHRTHPAPAVYPSTHSFTTPVYSSQQYIDMQGADVNASYSGVQPQSDTGGDGGNGDGGSGEGGEVMRGAGPGVIIDQEAVRILSTNCIYMYMDIRNSRSI